jgi:hypothetical protein
VATLIYSGVEFVAVDHLHANKLTIHILAAVAEHERAKRGRPRVLPTSCPRTPSAPTRNVDNAIIDRASQDGKDYGPLEPPWYGSEIASRRVDQVQDAVS